CTPCSEKARGWAPAGRRSRYGDRTTRRGVCTNGSGLAWPAFAARTTRARSRTRSCFGVKISLRADKCLPSLMILNREKRCGNFAVAVADPRSRRRSMNAQGQDLRELLLQTDEEFHRLAAKHNELEDRLHELTEKHYLSEPEQVEEVTLNKRKLQLKDRMEDILRRHRDRTPPIGSSGSPAARS